MLRHGMKSMGEFERQGIEYARQEIEQTLHKVCFCQWQIAVVVVVDRSLRLFRWLLAPPANVLIHDIFEHAQALLDFGPFVCIEAVYTI